MDANKGVDGKMNRLEEIAKEISDEMLPLERVVALRGEARLLGKDVAAFIEELRRPEAAQN